MSATVPQARKQSPIQKGKTDGPRENFATDHEKHPKG